MKAYLTPDTPPTGEYVCRRLIIPNSSDWLALVGGALASLIFLDSWQEFGTMTREEAAQAAKQIYQSYTEGVNTCMIGSIVPFATALLPPNVLPCDGSTHLREDFPILYDLLDTSLIVNADEFITPDLRGRVLLGAGEGPGLSDRSPFTTGGEEAVTLDLTEIPAHSHTYTPPTLNIDLEAPGAPDVLAAGVGLPTQTSEAGSGQPHENMPPYFVLTYGIIAK